MEFLRKMEFDLNETCQPYKSGNAKTQKRTPQKKAKERNFEKGLLKSFFLVMFVGDDLNCSFFFINL